MKALFVVGMLSLASVVAFAGPKEQCESLRKDIKSTVTLLEVAKSQKDLKAAQYLFNILVQQIQVHKAQCEIDV